MRALITAMIKGKKTKWMTEDGRVKGKIYGEPSLSDDPTSSYYRPPDGTWPFTAEAHQGLDENSSSSNGVQGARSEDVLQRITQTKDSKQQFAGNGTGMARQSSRQRPLVTVCIPTYNRRAWVLEAVDSIVKQSYTNWKLLIYDDGSIDGTWKALTERINRYPYRLREHITLVKGDKNRGNGFVRKWFKDNVDTEWSCWQDSDDLADPDRLKHQVWAVTRYNLDCCFSYINIFSDSRRLFKGRKMVIDITRYTPDDLWSLSKNIASPTGLMNSRARACIPDYPINHGGYDTLWISKMLCEGLHMGCVKLPIYNLRQHNNRIVSRKKKPEYKEAREVERLKIWELLKEMGMGNLGKKPTR